LPALTEKVWTFFFAGACSGRQVVAPVFVSFRVTVFSQPCLAALLDVSGEAFGFSLTGTRGLDAAARAKTKLAIRMS
jgi:hypothetical protein